MQRETFETLEEFVAAARARKVRGAAMHVVNEIRPHAGAGTSVIIGPRRYVDLSAYDAGVVLAARLADVDADTIERALTDAGLTVRRRSANIG